MVSVSFPLPRLDSCKAEPLASGPKWQELACCCWGKVESHHLSLTLHFSSSPPIYQIQTMKLWPAGTSPWLPAAPFVPWFSSAPGWGVLILFSCFIINVCAQLEHKPEFGPAPSWNASVASTVSGVLMRPHAGGALRLGFKFEWVCAFVFLPTGFCMNVNIPEAPEISWALPIHRPKPTLGLATFPNVPVQEIFIYFFQNKRKRWGSAQFLPHTPSKPRYVYEPNGTNGRFFFFVPGPWLCSTRGETIIRRAWVSGGREKCCACLSNCAGFTGLHSVTKDATIFIILQRLQAPEGIVYCHFFPCLCIQKSGRYVYLAIFEVYLMPIMRFL